MDSDQSISISRMHHNLTQSSACISFIIRQAVVIARQALDAAAVDNR